ncbi:hypothetical protein DSO57_1025145 [Entomophthora muscae]|uniref:Uncharacterized protein n=1 Tax=Entomophthora muscae TaxID=34485 RepID=A0ACC2RTB5_9FUNG|nr:hypothetical protein DSO57_1025145 [Entomophthora muscae]
MTLPLTLQPNRPQESVAASESTPTQLFGVMYITLTGLVDYMVPSNRSWATLQQFFGHNGSHRSRQKMAAVPLIGETAAKQTGLKKEIAKSSIFKFGFYSPAAGRMPSLAACPHVPASRGWRTLHGGTVHPCQMGKSSN